MYFKKLNYSPKNSRGFSTLEYIVVFDKLLSTSSRFLLQSHVKDVLSNLFWSMFINKCIPNSLVSAA
jgi:hypothetical protein